jgi:thiamine transport system permease protein
MAEISLTGFNITKILDSLSSKPVIRYIVYSSSIIFFFALILIPPVLGILLKWNLMGQVFEDPNLTARATSAISASFLIAIFVSVVDVAAGLPMAWFIVRGKARWLSIIDTLADIPFVVPTVTLGYSLLLFWNSSEGISSLFGSSLISPGWLLIILLHFTFSYPVVVRVLVGALLDYKQEYEYAARTLGASPLTADRTVTFPIVKPSIIAAFILAFARSISETGATFMVAGTFENGAVFIQRMKEDFNNRLVSQASYEGSLVFASFILIAISIAIFVGARLLSSKLKLPLKRVWPSTEKKLSGSGLVKTRNFSTLFIFFFLIIIPSLFVALPASSAIVSGDLSRAISSLKPWDGFWQSLVLSYFVALVAMLMNIVIGLPMAIMVARKRLGYGLSNILNALVDIPIIVPSVALGASLRIFWDIFVFMPELWVLVFAHISITYPYFVRAMAAAIERVPIELEEASRIFGGRPFTVFRTIILPLTKYSLFSGAIIMFTRSVAETGATFAVLSKGSGLRTTPVLLYDWVKGLGSSQPLATPLEISLACGFLIIFSFIILLVLRVLTKEKR